jgi:ribose transport system substrate-binding protein
LCKKQKHCFQSKPNRLVVIALDSAVDADVDAMISSNNTQAGEVACQYIADRLKGQGSVVILNGTPMDSINQRVSGCEKSLSKYPNIKLISKEQNAEGTRDGGLRVMSDLLTTFPKIDAVFAILPLMILVESAQN